MSSKQILVPLLFAGAVGVAAFMIYKQMNNDDQVEHFANLQFSRRTEPIAIHEESGDHYNIPQNPNAFGNMIGSHQQVVAPKTQLYNPDYQNPSDMMPTSGMGSINLEETSRPTVYHRQIYAPMKSRYQQQGDKIRGDIHIVPMETGWFRPAATTADLHPGALAHIGGKNYEASHLQSVQMTTRKTRITPSGDIIMA